MTGIPGNKSIGRQGGDGAFVFAGEFGYQYVKGDKITGHGQVENGGDGFDYNN
jgi:hypothetical protein